MWGGGGIVNMYGSVTSEQLPGVTEAVAQVCIISCVLYHENQVGAGGWGREGSKGKGGFINLYGSATSEQLPGVTEAVAQVSICWAIFWGTDGCMCLTHVRFIVVWTLWLCYAMLFCMGLCCTWALGPGSKQLGVSISTDM